MGGQSRRGSVSSAGQAAAWLTSWKAWYAVSVRLMATTVISGLARPRTMRELQHSPQVQKQSQRVGERVWPCALST